MASTLETNLPSDHSYQTLNFSDFSQFANYDFGDMEYNLVVPEFNTTFGILEADKDFHYQLPAFPDCKLYDNSFEELLGESSNFDGSYYYHQLSDNNGDQGNVCTTFGNYVPANNYAVTSTPETQSWTFQGHMTPISGENSTKVVGRYSVEERRDRILRYLKKRNQRNFRKTIKYACRKTLADRRVRIRGRFAKNKEEDHQSEPNIITQEGEITGLPYISANYKEEQCYNDQWLQEAMGWLATWGCHS